MSKKDSCETCRFFKVKSNGGLYKIGVGYSSRHYQGTCRFNPPKTPDSEVFRNATDWCGRHEAAPPQKAPDINLADLSDAIRGLSKAIEVASKESERLKAYERPTTTEPEEQSDG